MGCITSKAITRSMSIREELSHGFQSRSAAWEELLTSHSGNDQLFAFVCSSNINTTKLKTSSFTLPSTDTWDLISEIDSKAEADSPPDDSFKFTRSKSCHTMSENRLDLKDRSVAGSRSFHTVEEYDALLARIRGTRSLESFEDFFPWDDEGGGVKLQPLSDDAMCRGEESSASVESSEVNETGWKRKALAKGLKSLDISTPAPGTATGIARLKQRMVVQGQIYSPGTYVTPKFGSYNAPPPMPETEHSQKATFSPELVAAFEDCMQQLQAEEDSILRQMDDSLSLVANPSNM